MKKIFSNEAFEVMHNRNFRLFLMFRFFMTSATLMQSVVVGWLLYNITKDVLSLGMIGLTEVIPQVSIALFAGHFVDIWDRKKIIFYTTFLLLFGSIILLVYSLPAYDFHRMFGVVPIFVTIFLTGLTRGILMPANTALLGQLVPRKLLTGAATWNSTVWQVGAVTGPAIGGLVYGFFGVIPALSLVLFFYLLCTVLLLFIKSPGKIVVLPGSTEGIFARMREGIHYVFKNQILLGAFTLDMFAVLFGGAVAMLPVFASDVLKVGPEGLGILRACPAIGAIMMSVVLTFYPPVKRSGRLLLFSIVGFGLSMIVFALSKNFYLSAFVLFLSGVFDDVSVVIRASILQLFTSDEMKGRVAAVNSIFIGSSNELGAFESGVTARLMGLIPSVVFGGVMTLLVVTFAAVKSPTLRKLNLKM
ncbi:MAG: MFS transporter [Bacteroidetes bacterium]|nr:MFS transporter [Bacteroidota bacterium]MCL6101166.1 MFS transporter [Bacteroidota bacterium]